MKSQEYSQQIERMKSALNKAEGVTRRDYEKWIKMLDMFLMVKIQIENFEIGSQIDEQFHNEKIDAMNRQAIIREDIRRQNEDGVDENITIY